MHDVFISYSSRDKLTADAACAVLERNGVRCWIAPRDILPGASWGESIIDAIAGARIMVLVFSENANKSPQVEREIERAVNKGIPLIPMRIEDVSPRKSLEYFISTPHWLDAFTPPVERHLERLAEVVRHILATRFNSPLADVPLASAGATEPFPDPVLSQGRGAEAPQSAVVSPSASEPSAVRPETKLVAGDEALTGLGPLTGNPTINLPEADLRLLSSLVSSSDADQIVSRIDLLFGHANTRFDTSGAAKWINNTSLPPPPDGEKAMMSREINTALHFAARGLGWILRAAQLLPDSRPQLGGALTRADRLFYRIGWLTVAVGYQTLGISRRFEDVADEIDIYRQRARTELGA